MIQNLYLTIASLLYISRCDFVLQFLSCDFLQLKLYFSYTLYMTSQLHIYFFYSEEETGHILILQDHLK